MNTSIMNKLASSMALFALGSVLGLSGCIAESGEEDIEATESDAEQAEDIDSAEQAILGWTSTSEEYAPIVCPISGASDAPLAYDGRMSRSVHVCPLAPVSKRNG